MTGGIEIKANLSQSWSWRWGWAWQKQDELIDKSLQLDAENKQDEQNGVYERFPMFSFCFWSLDQKIKVTWNWISTDYHSWIEL